MTDKPYTPSTAEIRQEYTRDTEDWMLAGAEFDRWLAAHDEYKIREWTAKNDVVPHERYTRDIASVEQRGAHKGYEVGYRDGMRDEEQVQLGRYVQKINPYRADQMEGDV